MSEPVVIFKELAAVNDSKIGCITLNIPGTLNSLTIECVELLLDTLQRWEDDKSIACVFITGSGEKAFCAGGDVRALYESSIGSPGGPCIEAENFFAREYRMNYLLHRYNKPVVVWGDGIVMGGGLGIFAGGSHRVVTETSRFAMPEVTIALFPDVGGSYFLNRMPGAIGRFLALTGASFNAADAIFSGIANKFITRDMRDSVLIALSENACSNNDEVTEILAEFTDRSKSLLPVANVEPHLEIIDTLVGDLAIEQVIEKFAGLETDDKWLLKSKSNISHSSALSILLIDEQLHQCQDLSLVECFRRELILATNIMWHPEFAEGVRALLIDKDQNPQWKYKTIDDISREFLESFFVEPWKDHPLADLA